MEIRDTQERNTPAIRTSAPVEKLSEAMGSSYGEIMQIIGSSGIQPAGPPFAMYHNMDMSNLDVEMGFPVAVKADGRGRVKAGRLPGGKAASPRTSAPTKRSRRRTIGSPFSYRKNSWRANRTATSST